MTNIRSQSVLEGTISAATRDAATVSPDGSRLQRLTHGVTIRRLVTQTDSRGTVTELFDQRWREQEPLVFCYSFTIRPGVAKGWSLHRRHQDRYALLQGEMELILFDPRPDSPTCGEVPYRDFRTRSVPCQRPDRCLARRPQHWHPRRCRGELPNYRVRPCSAGQMAFAS